MKNFRKFEIFFEAKNGKISLFFFENILEKTFHFFVDNGFFYFLFFKYHSKTRLL